MNRVLPVVSASLLCLAPAYAFGCACGCGIFDVGTSSMLPDGPGGTAFLEYDFLDQNRNWSGTSSAPGADNTDKVLRTQFYTAGAEYMLDRSWGLELQAPLVERSFRTTDAGGNIVSADHTDLGDIRLSGIYSGFSSDMSTGVTFGLKLPSGNYKLGGFDRDTAIGTGSTDTLLGAYHLGMLGMGNRLNWFAQGTWDHPVIISAGYRPGDEVDAATGVYYDMGQEGPFTNVAPLLQVLGSGRFHDSGINADAENTGYTRLYLSPGIEAAVGRAKIYADVEVPVYQYMEGNQLVAPELFKVIVSFDF